MSPFILLAYSTVDGQTEKICRYIADKLADQGLETKLCPIGQADAEALDSSNLIVIGASIRYGHHATEVTDFINTHTRLLHDKPSAFFSVNLVARKPEKNTPDSNPYARKFLRKIPWKPRLAAVFAGRLDYPRYRHWDRQIIRVIMWMTGGPTDPGTVIEYTDWERVDAFVADLLNLLHPAA